MHDMYIVYIEDYAKGVFSYNATKQIIEQAQVLGKKVAVDPHRTTPIKYYRGADIFKPNRDEAFILSGLNLDDLRESRDSLGNVAQQLKELVDCEHLIVTLGKHGIVRFEEEQGFGVPTSARQVYDVAGAGDTVLAALSLGVAAGFNLNESCILANCAAGVVVSKIGCVPCELDELLSHLNS